MNGEVHYVKGTVEGICLERVLTDGRIAGVGPLLLGQGHIVVGRAEHWIFGHDEQWMYERWWEAMRAFIAWDGTGEPEGWLRHMPSGRRRNGGDPTQETVRE